MKYIEKLNQQLANGDFNNGLVKSVSTHPQGTKVCYEFINADYIKRQFCCEHIQGSNACKIFQNFLKKNGVKVIEKFHPAINIGITEKEYYRKALSE